MITEDTIYLGLCMAGAISAGAYTAGVMDYLIEALDEWERRRKQSPKDTPSHRVVIPVIGGASAGGVTSLITAAAINNPIKPIRELAGCILSEHPENKFYHSWVDLVQEDMFSVMLDTHDISKGNIYSLLNSDFIEKIAARAVEVDRENWLNRPYIDDTLKVFVTLSNLEGFSYNVAFNAAESSSGKYIIRKHSDFACFILSNKGEKTAYKGDGWIPLSFKEPINVDIAKGAAMATGAFPLGLRSRKISRLRHYIPDLYWNRFGDLIYDPSTDPYNSLHVDGGLINNEPFERVYELLAIRAKQNKIADTSDASQFHEQHIEQNEDIAKFRTTLLMIDPFPSEDKEFSANDSLPEVMGSTFSAMMGQLRVKPDYVTKAFNTNIGSHFLIAPKRKIPVRKEGGCIGEEDMHGAGAIACGSLDGFGGFLHKEFRIHDYFLGRANCERFLRHHFTVPLHRKHLILEKGYHHITDRKQFTGKNGLQIIPIFTKEKNYFYMPVFALSRNWPFRLRRDIKQFRPQLKKKS